MVNILQKFRQLSLFKKVVIIGIAAIIIVIKLTFFFRVFLISTPIVLVYFFCIKYLKSPKRKGIKIYEEKIKELLIDGNLSEEDKNILENIKKENGLKDSDVAKYNTEAFKVFFQDITKDSKISDEEKDELNKIYSYLSLSTQGLSYDTKNFTKYRTLYAIDKGDLPVVENHNLNVNLEPTEKIHFIDKAAIVKNKSITKRLDYSGLTASVKIAKGIRYRVGSIKIEPQKVNIKVIDDAGVVYLTTKEFGYFGLSKHFSFPYEKISSLDVREGYLYIYKKGKETPFIISMDDYELLLTILSVKMNS